MQAIEDFFYAKAKPILLNLAAVLVALAYAHISILGSIVSQATVLSWATAGVGALVVFLIHLVDHNYTPPADTGTTVTTVSAVTPTGAVQQVTTVPNAPTAVAPSTPSPLPPAK